LLSKNKDAIIVGSLGTICYDLPDEERVIKIKGAMGCALGVALGYAINTKKQVICLIGEGSLLMHLGSLATINKYKLKNLKVYILNNGVYKSCGGQQNNFNSLFSNDLQLINRGTYSVHKVA